MLHCTSGKHLHVTVKSRFAGVYFKEHFYAQLKIPMGSKVNFYQEIGLFNIYLKTFYVYIFKK